MLPSGEKNTGERTVPAQIAAADDAVFSGVSLYGRMLLACRECMAEAYAAGLRFGSICMGNHEQ